MEFPDHYQQDVLLFFEGHPLEQSLYETLLIRLEQAFPDTHVKVQKSQISFYGRHLFAAVSLPVRRRKDWPAHCLVFTLGLARRLDSPRVAVAVEPYPGRWTHHILLTEPEQIDALLLEWVGEAWQFSQTK